MTRPIFNDRLAVNLPGGMKERLQEIATEQGMTMSTYLRLAVMNSLREDEARRIERHAEA